MSIRNHCRQLSERLYSLSPNSSTVITVRTSGDYCCLLLILTRTRSDGCMFSLWFDRIMGVWFLFFLTKHSPTHLHTEMRWVSWDLTDFSRDVIASDMYSLSLSLSLFRFSHLTLAVWCPGTGSLLLFPDSWLYDFERPQSILIARVCVVLYIDV